MVSIAAGILAGILPALRTPRRLAEQALGDGTRRWPQAVAADIRQALVTAEVSLAVVLVVGSGLMIRTLAELSRVDVGFRTDDVLTTRVTLPAAIYARGSEIMGFFAELEERIRACPASYPPVSFARCRWPTASVTYSIQIEGREVETIGETPHTYLQLTSPGYFRALGLARNPRPTARRDRHRGQAPRRRWSTRPSFASISTAPIPSVSRIRRVGR